jgi:hypothetical protein
MELVPYRVQLQAWYISGTGLPATATEVLLLVVQRQGSGADEHLCTQSILWMFGVSNTEENQLKTFCTNPPVDATAVNNENKAFLRQLLYLCSASLTILPRHIENIKAFVS